MQDHRSRDSETVIPGLPTQNSEEPKNRPACAVWMRAALHGPLGLLEDVHLRGLKPLGRRRGLGRASLGILVSPASPRISHTAVRDKGVPARASS